MKIIPPAAEKDRKLWKARMERELRRMQGGRWRVDLIAGRYGWYARAVRLRNRKNGHFGLPAVAAPTVGAHPLEQEGWFTSGRILRAGRSAARR